MKHQNNELFNKQLWTITDTATYLNLSVGTLYNFVWKREIPFHKKRKRLYFIPREIQNWVLEGN